jgi:membrane-associated phospholipid phosphatase
MYLIKTTKAKKPLFLLVKSIAVLLFLPFFSIQAQVTDSCLVEACAGEKIKSKIPNIHTIKAIIFPASLISYGFISTQSSSLKHLDHRVANGVRNNNLLIHSDLDDYMQYSPAIVAFGLKLSGIKSKHNLADMSIIYALSCALEGGTVHSLKKLTARMRPDDSAHNSFPSGHTATAFIAAEFLYQEYKDQSLWIGISGYTIASFIGISRILKNRHWVSDVVAGTGFGILSTRIVYWVYPYLKELCSTKEVFIHPSYDNETLSLKISCKF